MSIRFLVGAISLAVAIGGIFAANLLQFEIVTALNRLRPSGEQIRNHGWWWDKTMRVHEEYRHAYPEGRLPRYMWAAFGIGVAGLLVCAICIGIIPLPIAS